MKYMTFTKRYILFNPNLIILALHSLLYLSEITEFNGIWIGMTER